MNAPFFDRARVRLALSAVGERHGLAIRDLLPSGSVGHVSETPPVVFLAEKTREDLSLIDLCSAEIELQDSLGFPTRILLQDELDASPGGRDILAGARSF